MDQNKKHFRHERMAIREEWEPEEIQKISDNIEKYVENEKANQFIFWRLLPFALLIIFFAYAVIVLIFGG